ncbi:MAG: hypothetical protein H6832_10335 [Planctomycetes bacterium]|nr:hypothetical protein [Planctomycetota bacterium]MCB9918787.1 hypothetical protein [Planctomycetota bacterium]
MRKLRLVSVLACTPNLSARTTRVVGSGGTYHRIQAAINASVDGGYGARTNRDVANVAAAVYR